MINSKANKANQKLFKSIKGIMVIQGRHLRHNSHFEVFMNDKPYNWRITHRTHNIKYAKVGNISSVIDNGTKNFIVITKIIHATGSQAIRMAKRLKPVVNFQNRELKNHKLIEIDPKKRRNSNQRIARAMNYRNVPKKEIAKRLNVSVSTIYNWLRK